MWTLDLLAWLRLWTLDLLTWLRLWTLDLLALWLDLRAGRLGLLPLWLDLWTGRRARCHAGRLFGATTWGRFTTLGGSWRGRNGLTTRRAFPHRRAGNSLALRLRRGSPGGRRDPALIGPRLQLPVGRWHGPALGPRRGGSFRTGSRLAISAA